MKNLAGNNVPNSNFDPSSITRRSAVKLIMGASAAIALCPTAAFGDDVPAEGPQDPALMNSWRYVDGELPENDTSGYMSRSTAPYGQDADGNWCNSQGDPIPGALFRGIDVSVHQGTIDWGTVKQYGNIDFAIIRCGYGSDYSSQDDLQFLNNVNGCLSNQIPFGIYLYSYACNTSMAHSEAHHVLRLLKTAGLTPSHLVYPVYLDLEQEHGGRPAGVDDKNNSILLSNAALADIAMTFCDTVDNAGYRSGVYANTNWWTNYLTDSSFNNRSKWVAQYNPVCTYAGSYDIWQAGSDARIPGVTGNVDINFDLVGAENSLIWSRIFGQDQLDTMQRISQTGWSASDNVVVATQDTYWDALTASSLAGIYDCPILLTSSSALSPQTKAAIQELGATTAYIIGGPIAISSSVDSAIKNAGCKNVIRVYGQDQQGTARAIAQRVVDATAPNTCIIATSWKFQDALSISPYAFWSKTPIFLCEDGSNKLSAETEQAIKNARFSRAIIVGGPIAVDSGVEGRLQKCGISSIERLYGQTEYETSCAIARWELTQGMSVNKMALATGRQYYDALAGGALCGSNGSVLVIESNSNRIAITDFIASNRNDISEGYVFGGPIAVSDASWLTLLRAQAGRIQ